MMRICVTMALLAAITVMAGCRGRDSETAEGATAKVDSQSVSYPAGEKPEAVEGMAYREERDAAAQAQYEFGLKHETGAGVTRNQEEAVRLYRLAAGQGNAPAQNALGSCYEHGKGVAVDPRQAVKWYLASAAQGYAEAQFNLGSCYHRGKGVAMDHKEAARLYRLAAEQGLAIAQYMLGNCFFDGEDVSRDYQEAYFWGLIAVRNGVDDLRGLRDAAAEQLSSRQQEEIRARAGKWLAEHQE